SVVSADTLMDAVLAERLPRCLKRFASILRSRLNASRHTVFVHQRMGRLFVLEARKEFAPEGFYKGPRERVPPFVLPMGTCPFDVELDAELSFLRFSIDEDIAPSSLGSPSVPATSTRIVCVRLKLRLLWFPMSESQNRFRLRLNPLRGLWWSVRLKIVLADLCPGP
ncbi:hypothetical protein FOZ61_005114, partial [Perkinsus olseni]